VGQSQPVSVVHILGDGNVDYLFTGDVVLLVIVL
jgi:hypothetical protein